MDASDLIKALQNILRGRGRPPMGNPGQHGREDTSHARGGDFREVHSLPEPALTLVAGAETHVDDR
jgi:hypothetical protein